MSHAGPYAGAYCLRTNIQNNAKTAKDDAHSELHKVTLATPRVLKARYGGMAARADKLAGYGAAKNVIVKKPRDPVAQLDRASAF